MKEFFFRLYSHLFKRNHANTPISIISDQLYEPRPLPMGKSEFDTWAERIISGAMCPAEHDSQKFALANMIMHLGPTEHMKPDIHFISQLRKVAVNQIADAVRQEIHSRVKSKADEEKSKADQEVLKKVDADVEATLNRIEGAGESP